MQRHTEQVGKRKTVVWFTGHLGELSVKENSWEAAFDEVVARHLGYECAADLRARNSKVRAQMIQRRRALSEQAERFVSGNLEQSLDALEDVGGWHRAPVQTNYVQSMEDGGWYIDRRECEP